MEPLSIAGSIVGLIVATQRISSLLTTIISETRDAPKNILEIKVEADNLRGTLEQLQLLLLGRSRLLLSRTSLIRVDQVVLTLTACVSNISDLELLLRPLKSDGSIGVLDRIGWVHNTEIVKDQLSRLQMHKSSLALILSILTCESSMNAEATVANLVAIFERLAESNEMIVNRILSGQVESDTIRETETLRETDTIREAPFDLNSPCSLLDLTPTATAQAVYFGFDFDDQLENSRVYQRAMKNEDNFSLSAISSAERTASWSILSGISLSQVSNIATVRLPISKNEISNAEDYGFEFPDAVEFVISSPPLSPATLHMSTSSSLSAAEDVDMLRHYRFIRTIARSRFHVPVYNLEFEQGDILFVYREDESRAFATLLRTRRQGWLAKSYYEVYEPEVLQKIMQAVASLVKALETPTVVSYREDLQPINEIVAGVRYLLERTGCRTRNTQLLSHYAALRNIRKGLLSALSDLVNTGRQIHQKAISTKLTRTYILDKEVTELTRKGFKLLRKAVFFHDTYENICTTADRQTSVALPEPVSERLFASVLPT